GGTWRGSRPRAGSGPWASGASGRRRWTRCQAQTWWSMPSVTIAAFEVFTPYRPGPSRDTWKRFGQRQIALAAAGLLSDWPRPLRPPDDPHVRIIAERLGKSGAQVLLRWALQLGLAVVFRASPGHVRENLALDFELSPRDAQLISGLATLAEPLPPGDGFVHPYEPLPKMKREL
ncbi:unnamed protein product, partial [Effrenium voratum]